jgi:hypothetical protein
MNRGTNRGMNRGTFLPFTLLLFEPCLKLFKRFKVGECYLPALRRFMVSFCSSSWARSYPAELLKQFEVSVSGVCITASFFTKLRYSTPHLTLFLIGVITQHSKDTLPSATFEPVTLLI